MGSESRYCIDPDPDPDPGYHIDLNRVFANHSSHHPAPFFIMSLHALQVNRCLSAMDEWTFDMFELSEVTNSRPLSTLSYALLHRLGIVAGLRLNEQKLARCVGTIPDLYSLQITQIGPDAAGPHHHHCSAVTTPCSALAAQVPHPYRGRL